jgi:Aspartyl protease
MSVRYFIGVCVVVSLVLTCVSASPSQAGGDVPRKDAPSLSRLLEAEGYIAFPFRPLGGYIGIDAKINGRARLLVVDTGAPQSHLDPSRVRDVKWEPVPGGTKPASICLLDSVELGTIKLGSRWMYSVDLSDPNAAMGDRADGLLGADILGPHGAVIDYPSRTLFLKPTAVREIVRADSSPRPAPPVNDRCRVGFWNLTGREVTLTVGDRTVTLAKHREISLDLERQFSWRIDGRPARLERVPNGEATLEITIMD